MQLLLEIRSGSNAGTKISLNPGQPLRVGRTSKADHSFPDDKLMSSLHFAIEYGEKGCRILDLQSSNGTFLNGARVKEATLATGDEIRAGNTVFVVQMLPDEALLAESSKPQPPKPELLPASGPAPKPAQTPPSPAPAPGLYGGLPSFPARAPKFELPPAGPQPSPNLPHLAPRQPRLRDLLAKDFQPLYALLDASREPSVLKVILESKEEHQSLYEGPQGSQLAHFAPYLIRVPQK